MGRDPLRRLDVNEMKNNRLFGQNELHGAGNIGRGLLALALAAVLAGCNKAPENHVEVTPANFKGDTSKMPADARARMVTQQAAAQAQMLAEQAKHK